MIAVSSFASPASHIARRDRSGSSDGQPSSPAALVFVHIPKTGGSTLCNVLGRQYPGETQYWIRPGTDRVAAGQALRRLDDEHRRRLRLVTGHVPYGLHEDLRPHQVRYVTVLRDPVSRLRSLYLFTRGRPRNPLYDVAQTAGLAEFAQSEKTAQLDNDQTRFLAGGLAVGADPFDRPVTEEDFERARRHLIEFAAVGVTERFDESLLAMRALFGWKLPLYSAQKVSAGSVDVTDEARASILARNRFDQALYEVAVDLCRALVDATGVTSQKVRRFRAANRAAQPAAALYRRLHRLRRVA